MAFMEKNLLPLPRILPGFTLLTPFIKEPSLSKIPFLEDSSVFAYIRKY